MTSLRVLLAEDHAVVREGTREILERDPELTVVGEAADGAAVVEMAERLRPDVVLMDLGLPGVNGIEATQRITAGPNRPRVLVLSAYDDEDYVIAAIEAGAGGYLLKSAHATEVVAAIRVVASGQLVLDPGVARHVLGRRADGVPGRDELASRELEVLRLAATGSRTRDIAERLGVSGRTVEAILTNVFNKLGVTTRTEAIVVAASRGWIRFDRDRSIDAG